MCGDFQVGLTDKEGISGEETADERCRELCRSVVWAQGTANARPETDGVSILEEEAGDRPAKYPRGRVVREKVRGFMGQRTAS